MAISIKTRKTIWGRSGNRCAFCKIELVSEKDENSRALNIGEECHIISSKSTGPRHKVGYTGDIDGYENLILLCRNHHKTVDEQVEKYSESRLKQLKVAHEAWVKKAIDDADVTMKTPEAILLHRVTTGKELVEIISEVDGYSFDHDELENEEEVDLIASLFQNLEDYGDLISMGSFEKSRQIRLGFDLTKDIKEIEDAGFFIFGNKDSSDSMNGQIASRNDPWQVAFIRIIRNSNSGIINLQEILSKASTQ